MNIEIKDISDTRKNLLVTLDKSEVDGEYNAVVAEFAKVARIPGFRPGRAPAAMVVRRFSREIQEEFKQKLLQRAYRDGVKKSSLDVITLADVQEGTVQAGMSAGITFTVDIRPAFEMPEYAGIPAVVPPSEPLLAEVDASIQALRAERAEFRTVERASQKGDYVRYGYEGTAGGQPVAALVPDRAIYGAAPQTWEEVGSAESMIPGLAAGLEGLRAGESRDVTISFPAGFSVPALAGREVVYHVTIQEVRERVLPEVDEAFLKAHNVATAADLDRQVRESIRLRKEGARRASIRRQVSDAMLQRASFPAPEALVEQETQGVLRQFIEENMRRGAKPEDFEKNKDELHASASKMAANRVRLQLMLAKIAEKEKIEITGQDLDGFLLHEAMRSGTTVEKLGRELQKNPARLRALQQSLLFDKALDFVVERASVTVQEDARI